MDDLSFAEWLEGQSTMREGLAKDGATAGGAPSAAATLESLTE